ncbi:hypothetical protein [Devosia soli]|uniref:hypothetical protein n=1 Tax=Devosia soli TaxID=361041 RepID=UPI00128DC56A|nr:hypothetical protein [Devosia soli]
MLLEQQRQVIPAGRHGRVADYHLRGHIARGDLVEVLAETSLAEDDEIHAVFKGATHMPVRTRVFLDFFVPRLPAFLQRQKADPDCRPDRRGSPAHIRSACRQRARRNSMGRRR